MLTVIIESYRCSIGGKVYDLTQYSVAPQWNSLSDARYWTILWTVSMCSKHRLKRLSNGHHILKLVIVYETVLVFVDLVDELLNL